MVTVCQQLSHFLREGIVNKTEQETDGYKDAAMAKNQARMKTPSEFNGFILIIAGFG